METQGTNILNELKEFSPLLAGMEKTNVFSVPQGYFDSLHDSVLVVCQNEINILSGFSKQFPSSVPEGYFEQLAGSILNKIKNQHQTSADEIRTLSPMLYSIQNENVFDTPKGYFGSLTEEILHKAAPVKAKIVPMRTRGLFMRYASAAVVISFMALGVFKFAGKQSPHSSVAAAITASLDPYIQQGKGMSDQQFNQGMDNLSADDIANYLEKNGNESDVASLESNIDDNNLPSQDDYLLDEKALENYLSDNSAKQTNN